jgi:acyl-coenzyme A thioesterase PaaI-like protein
MAIDLKTLDFKKIDLLKWSEKLPAGLRLPALSKALEVMIPFNSGLGMTITHLTSQEARIQAADKRRRRNHVASAHACFLALLSEYPAGLLVAQQYSFQDYRMILSTLKITYFKQGRGVLIGTAKAPEKWPEFVNGEAFIDMQTTITNVKEETVAHCETRWQVKEWARVRQKSV